MYLWAVLRKIVGILRDLIGRSCTICAARDRSGSQRIAAMIHSQRNLVMEKIRRRLRCDKFDSMSLSLAKGRHMRISRATGCRASYWALV